VFSIRGVCGGGVMGVGPAYGVPSGGGSGITDGDKGDITVSGGGSSWTLDDKTVTNAKLADVTTGVLKGRHSDGAGAVEDLTPEQATSMLLTFTDTLKGLTPPPVDVSGFFLRDDGSWVDPIPASIDICLSAVDATGQTFTFAAATPRQLTLLTEAVNPGSHYDTATGRYTPTKAGVYEVNGVIQTPTVASTGIAFIYKNGVSVAGGTYIPVTPTSGMRVGVTTLVYMNGTTDYLELWGYSSGAGTSAAGNGVYIQFNARLVSI